MVELKERLVVGVDGCSLLRESLYLKERKRKCFVVSVERTGCKLQGSFCLLGCGGLVSRMVVVVVLEHELGSGMQWRGSCKGETKERRQMMMIGDCIEVPILQLQLNLFMQEDIQL